MGQGVRYRENIFARKVGTNINLRQEFLSETICDLNPLWNMRPGLTSGSMSAFELPCAKSCFTFFRQKRDKNSYLVENAAIYMEGNQQTQSQGATKQAMIYICGGKKKSKLKSHLFSESRRSFNSLTAQRAGQHVQI